MNLIEQLTTALTDAKPDNRNTLNSYLPYRNKGNNFNYSYVAGHTLGLLIGKVLNNKFDQEAFENDCLKKVGDLLSDESFTEHLRKMYFTGDALSQAAPEFLLLTQQSNEKGASSHLFDIFESFLAANPASIKLQSNPNFIEEKFLEVLDENFADLTAEQKASTQAPYLPFLARNFVKDLGFLSHKTDFLLQHLEQFIELYNFLYCSQLALNIRDWPNGEPQSKPLFFILDTEKASQERTDIQHYGYQSLYRASAHVFPILSMLEQLNKNPDKTHQKQPLWKFADAIRKADTETETQLKDVIESFAQEFFESRGLTKTYEYSSGAIDSLRRLFHYAEDQFQVEKGDRKTVRKNYQKEFEKHVARHFVQLRGRTGRVLVMNQDYLLLLTNLVIGKERKLHFQKLLEGFRSRGVYFDKQSEQSLISFYDRVGNVDRLSDSGDAVYVRSTI
ncbi:DNA phosphorothioation-dependent restriction protein DptG [Parendozoicomonas sp. Alg238-R29]|uniref:DNA phosphorothioation-dependent restriction protein DptG n=1 Tax=Parendozoicomonas sp. Alg238-R29 TaxID=2993446 RepID=UPI00248DE4F9|nr:DNA phosphorothioation-dependent restriction protein DptG [Parendozoicomonas sp. Alg238-R29]